MGIFAGRQDIYVSKWFAFERFHFLLDKDEPKDTLNTETVSCCCGTF